MIASKFASSLPIFVLLLMIVGEFLQMRAGRESLLALSLLAGTLVIYILICRIFVWSLVEEVFDAGDHLVIRNGKSSLQISLTDIDEVIDKALARPPRVIVRLSTPSVMGTALAFVPMDAESGVNFRGSIARDLRLRVEAAKAGKSSGGST